MKLDGPSAPHGSGERAELLYCKRAPEGGWVRAVWSPKVCWVFRELRTREGTQLETYFRNIPTGHWEDLGSIMISLRLPSALPSLTLDDVTVTVAMRESKTLLR